MTPFTIAQLCLFALMMAAGQIFFKKAAMTAPALNSVASLFALGMNAWFWGALALYGAATLLWVSILQKAPLALAYPFAALAFVFVPAIAYFMFHETITLPQAAGMAVILAGIGVIAVSST